MKTKAERQRRLAATGQSPSLLAGPVGQTDLELTSPFRTPPALGRPSVLGLLL